MGELEFLFTGTQTIDVEDWKRHTEYVGGLAKKGTEHEVVRWFWEVLDEFSEEQRTRLLQFSTGSSRVPAQGFKALQRNDGKYQRFTLDSADGGGQFGWLPLAHTCF